MPKVRVKLPDGRTAKVDSANLHGLLRDVPGVEVLGSSSGSGATGGGSTTFRGGLPSADELEASVPEGLPRDPGFLRSTYEGLKKGATFGLDDELGAWLESKVGKDWNFTPTTYDEALARRRAVHGAADYHHPGGTAVGDIAGSLASGGAVVKGAGRAARGLTGAVGIGAATGGARAAGQEDEGDRARAALGGAVGGALTGGLTYGAASALGRLKGALTPPVSAEKAATQLAQQKAATARQSILKARSKKLQQLLAEPEAKKPALDLARLEALKKFEDSLPDYAQLKPKEIENFFQLLKAGARGTGKALTGKNAQKLAKMFGPRAKGGAGAVQAAQSEQLDPGVAKAVDELNARKGPKDTIYPKVWSPDVDSPEEFREDERKDYQREAKQLADNLHNHVQAFSTLNTIEEELGFPLEAADKYKDRANLPGFNLPGVGRIAATESARDLDRPIRKLFNIELKTRSGASVTSTELERLKREFASGRFNTEPELLKALQDYKKELRDIFQTHALGFSGPARELYTRDLEKTRLRK